MQELPTREKFMQLWAEMYRQMKGCDAALQPLAQARRLLDARDKSLDGGPEHIELTRNLADGLDKAHDTFAALTKVSSELASAVRACVDVGTAEMQASEGIAKQVH